MTSHNERTAAASGSQSVTKQESPVFVRRNSRSGVAVICVAILLLALASPTVKAAFVVESDSVFGASSVVLDTDTGLYWVKPTETLGLAYATVQTDIATGLAGNFAYASDSQVRTLFSDAGITDVTNALTAGNYAGAAAIVSAFGQTSGGTFSNGSYSGPYAQVGGVYAGDNDAFTMEYRLNATGEFGCTSADCGQAYVGVLSGSPAGSSGSWLVASSLDSGNKPPPVPLPASGWLLLSAIGGLGLLSRRRGARLARTTT
jgi:hypothetical protein